MAIPKVILMRINLIMMKYKCPKCGYEKTFGYPCPRCGYDELFRIHW